jgi:hypothetical protein
MNYKRLPAIVKREVRKVKRRIWERFVCNDIEHDVHGRQIKAYKILKSLKKPLKDNLKLNSIPEQQCLDYYQELWSIKMPNV